MAIETYWPKDTDNEIYIAGNSSLADIQTKIEEKWPGVKPDEISIESEYIHTNCLNYDLYDSSDYTCFIVIRRLTQ